MNPQNPVIDVILQPLSAFYDDLTTIECRMGEAYKIVTERRGKGKEYHDAPDLSLAAIEDICHALANHHNISYHPDTRPKLSCILPNGSHRFECLVGSSVRSGISLAIRCKHPFTPSWELLGVDDQILAYFKQSMRSENNMLVSGATSTGKTTFLNMMLGFLDDDCRIVTMEDTPELHIDRFWDKAGLIATREEVAEAQTGSMVNWRMLYDHSTRISPDHIIFGEISTTNSFAALSALNSGITGFACTLHAASPEQALDRKFVQNIAWSGQDMPRVPEFLRELIDVVIQIKRGRDGNRRITDIYEPVNDHWVMKDRHFYGSKQTGALQ